MFDTAREEILRVIFEASKRTGERAYVVGGFPRDILVGRFDFSDIDIIVFGDHRNFATSILVQLERPPSIEIQKYKLIRIFHRGITIDVSEPKGSDLTTDLKRRDFTINALVIPVDHILDPMNNIIDPIGKAREDLMLRLLRTPVNPSKTLRDDPVRIVRAARFIADEFVPEDKLVEESRRRIRSLTSVPKERIGEELRNLFLAKKPSAGLTFLRDIGFFHVLFPKLVPALNKEQKSPFHFEGVFEHCVRVTDLTPPDIVMRISGFFHDIGKAYAEKMLPDGRYVYWGHEFISAEICREFLANFKFPEAEREKAEFIVRNHMIQYSESWSDSAIRRLIKKLHPYIDDVLEFISYDIKALREPSKLLKNLDELKLRIRKEILRLGMSEIKSPIDGYEIQRIFGLRQGRIIGEIKSAIENAIIEGKIRPTKEDAIEFARRLISEMKFDAEKRQ